MGTRFLYCRHFINTYKHYRTDTFQLQHAVERAIPFSGESYVIHLYTKDHRMGLSHHDFIKRHRHSSFSYPTTIYDPTYPGSI
ncbi:hypothetical protein M3201_12875 [Paenibacillus motobuensis]|uniref:hypothetical protein n=1 Tax=Paenibacillus TaxID=44249 RepID=UPI00203C90D2|nr:MULTISPECIES: hypothetical protein [Paenibacillus]MCM3040588.1 hypothetical protein [Paenibacillus lutimineralis]MCM3647692.1 hypothetical protein [Paenibacillus motobuensis]